MMKCFFILILFFSALQAQGNDTLTRAQVYNFNVGDTFDYKYYSSNSYLYNPSQISLTITYARYFITGIYYSPDSVTKYIQRERLYPQPQTFDTLTLKNISTYEVELDTPNCNSIITIVPNSHYNGRIANILGPYIDECSSPYHHEDEYVDGLGNVLSLDWGSVPYGYDPTWNDTTELIYCAKGSETWGNPYYDFPATVQPLNTTNAQISLFPTINNGTFNLKITNGNRSAYQFAVYDLTGRTIKTAPLNNGVNNIMMDNSDKGMYLWSVISEGTILQSGKMIVN